MVTQTELKRAILELQSQLRIAEEELQQWRTLSDPATLHACLLRGLPCVLPMNLLLHLAGDEVQSAVAERDALKAEVQRWRELIELCDEKTKAGVHRAAYNRKLAELRESMGSAPSPAQQQGLDIYSGIN